MKKNLFRLDGKVIIVTGALGLLGRRHVEAISCYGGTPILLDLSQDEVDNLANQMNDKYKVNAIGFSVDISDESSVKSNAELLFDKFGKIDGLVNNAANNPKVEKSNNVNFSRLENFSIDLWNEDILVGLTGSFLCAKHYGQQIAQNPNGGCIINISSDLGLNAPDQRLYSKKGLDESAQNVKPVSYSVIKSGLIGLTRYLATYWPEKNVRCNALCPGGIENGQPLDFVKKVSAKIPMGRMASSDEYQSTLVWMLSDSSRYLKGAIIPVEGGRTIW